MNEEAAHLVARLIELVGSKRKAKELIDGASLAGAKGRPGGTLTYREVDQRLIVNAISLELLWEKRRCEPPPFLELVRKQVEICWRDRGMDEDGERTGEWDGPTCFLLLLGTLPRKKQTPPDTAALCAFLAKALVDAEALVPEDRLALEDAPLPAGIGDVPALEHKLGKNPEAVMRRIANWPKLTYVRRRGYWRFDSPSASGRESFWKDPHALGISLAPESWAILHFQFPKHGLLPSEN
jgi:hypothetical protein